jgi:hypothetical protein
MKLIVMENLYPKLGIVNGNINYIKNLLITNATLILKNKKCIPQ